MYHKPILFTDLSLSYPHKTCFEAFNGEIRCGERIAVIGRNGSGKSTLLQILCGTTRPTDGEIKIPADLRFGYLPQIISDFAESSGGERFNLCLTEQLAKDPELLLLDEPTNHLDSRNRRSLIRLLRQYAGTLVIVSHDVELITAVTDTLWHIEAQKIRVFYGNYQDYQSLLRKQRLSIEQELASLSRQKNEVHRIRMEQQERNKKARIKGEKQIQNRKWPTIRSHSKMANAITTGDKRLKLITEHQQALRDKLSTLYFPEIIQAKFSLTTSVSHKVLIAIQEASVAYQKDVNIIANIHFHLRSSERIAICGDNGCGKSTFVKAILGDPSLYKTGDWITPSPKEIGYLDQYYQQLNADKTVLELTQEALPKSSHSDIRSHLNNFLFRKNEEVQTKVKNLSGGEKARLSLALIAARPPKLLILDELTNNLDRETRSHVIEVLGDFPAAMLIISHDQDFLNAIGVERQFLVHQAQINEVINNEY